MVSFADYKKSGALEAKKKVREAEEAIEAQKDAEPEMTSTPDDADSTQPTGAHSNNAWPFKKPWIPLPAFSTVPCVDKVFVTATTAPAWGGGKVKAGVALANPKSGNGEPFESALQKPLSDTARQTEYRPWTPPRPGSPSYKARLEKIGFKVPQVTDSATSSEPKKPKPSRYKPHQGHRYAADETAQELRVEAQTRGLMVRKPDDRHYVAGLLKHNDRTFYELVEKYKSASMELLLNKVKVYHLAFDVNSTAYSLMGDEISEIEARKATNKWDEQHRLAHEQRLVDEEETERRRQQDMEQRARRREEAQARKEKLDREKALKARGNRIRPTNDFMKDLGKVNKIAEERAKARADKRRTTANASSSEALKERSKTGINPVAKTSAAKYGKDEVVKKSQVQNAEKPSKPSTAVKTSTKRKAENLDITKQGPLPKAKRSTKGSSFPRASISRRHVLSTEDGSSALRATEETSESPQKKARTHKPVRISHSSMQDEESPHEDIPSPESERKILETKYRKTKAAPSGTQHSARGVLVPTGAGVAQKVIKRKSRPVDMSEFEEKDVTERKSKRAKPSASVVRESKLVR